MKKWNLRNLSITWGAILVNANFGASGALVYTPNEDDYKLVVSPDGVGSLCATNNTSGKFQVKLAQTSEINAQLSAARILGILSQNAASVAPFTVRDLEGTTLIACLNAWISRPPDGDWQQEITERVWAFESDDVKLFHGGN